MLLQMALFHSFYGRVVFQCVCVCVCVCIHIFFIHIFFKEGSLVAQRLKRLPPVWKTWVRSLGREDPLEKEMATHSSILA